MIAFLSRLLTPRRLGYAWIAGGALWLGWVASMLLGSGNRDTAGNVIGADFLAFYTGGRLVANGQSADLYDLRAQQKVQQPIAGDDWPGLDIYFNPPFYALFCVPFAQLPYRVSAAIWMALSLVGLWISMRLLGLLRSIAPLVWALTWMPIFTSVSFGQNTLFSLAILCMVYVLWRKEQRWIAGLVCSLLLYKPQLILGISLLWLLEWRKDWRALAGLALGAVGLAGLSFGLMPEASRAYVTFSGSVLPGFTTWEGFPLWNAHTPRSFWQLLFPGLPILADALFLLCAIGGIWGFIRFRYRMRDNQALLFAGAICLTLWITPHAMIYDWTILLIPAILLWEMVPKQRRAWQVLFALVWAATFLSGPLTLLQMKLLPFAVQISVLVLLVVFVSTYRTLDQQPGPQMPPQG